jgi:transcriptional regulator with XRE-family HTH domain
MKRKKDEDNPIKEPELILIGNRLRAARESLKLTQANIIKKLEMHNSNYSEIETGKVKPSIIFITKLYKIFNINPMWILLGEEPIIIQPGVKKKSFDYDVGEQTANVHEMLRHMEESPIFRSLLTASYMKIYIENEVLIERDKEAYRLKKEEETGP